MQQNCLAKKEGSQKLDYWVTKNPNRNYWVPEIGYPIIFGSDTVRHPSDPKFWVPEPKALLVRVPDP